MTPRLLIGLVCVYSAAHGMTAVAAPPHSVPIPVTYPIVPGEPEQSGGHVRNLVSEAHQIYGRALSGKADALAALYLDDARSFPDQQPALRGNTDILAWYAAMRGRRKVIAYEPKIREIFDFSDTLVETGGFSIGWKLANGQTETADGKYLHVWARQTDGTLRLKADVRNWLTAPADNRAFYVDLPKTEQPTSPQMASMPMTRSLCRTTRQPRLARLKSGLISPPMSRTAAVQPLIQSRFGPTIVKIWVPVTRLSISNFRSIGAAVKARERSVAAAFACGDAHLTVS
jgi:ketosteroid isomerase-like protein